MARLWCLDTNVLISGLVFRGPEHSLLRRLQDRQEPVLWFPTIENEVQEVLARKFGTVDVDWAGAFPTRTRLIVQEPPPDLHIEQAIKELRDPKDGPILAAARFYKADFLVTGDKDLLVLGQPDDSRKALRNSTPTHARLSRKQWSCCWRTPTSFVTNTEDGGIRRGI
ncbi:putative toxin-antitoxin system toxin component, PIN family [Kyrpidia spormannii]|uniref:putative toxin-antitoxin system toxin component, PIN family n=1 Tax=Kyrpidia spormannii TaxID=2055160 RepID=UPI0018E497A7